jgi:hypothetical protein
MAAKLEARKAVSGQRAEHQGGEGHESRDDDASADDRPQIFPSNEPENVCAYSTGGKTLKKNRHIVETGVFTAGRLFEPFLETSWAKAWVGARSEALIVHLYAVVKRLGVRNHLS